MIQVLNFLGVQIDLEVDNFTVKKIYKLLAAKI